MSTAKGRVEGVKLRLLDLAGIEEFALQAYLTERPGATFTSLRVGFSPWGIVARAGVMYAVNVEGVGEEVTDPAPLILEMFGETHDADGKMESFTMMPVMEYRLTRDEVMERLSDEIDLSDLIRTFGQRLEDNFWLWHEKLVREAHRG